MKRAYPDNNTPSSSSSSYNNTYSSVYVETDNKYSIHDKIVYYRSNPINNRIAQELLQYRLIKKPDLVPDFEINNDIGVFVRTSDAYSQLPNEVFNLSSKIKKNQAGHNYVLQVFLLIVNKEELKSPLVEEVSARCVFSDLTFIVCWDILSAATYIKNVKMYEKRGGEIIQKSPQKDLESQASYVLTSISGVNKDNANVLMKKYRTMTDIMTANLDDLSEIQGLGNKRVLNIYQTFQQEREN